MVYYGHFLVDDSPLAPIDTSASEHLLFAQTLLGDMSPTFQAHLDPTTRKPQRKPKSFQWYLRDSPNCQGDENERMSAEEYQNVEELLKRMLAWEANNRITVKDALSMPFLQ